MEAQPGGFTRPLKGRLLKPAKTEGKVPASTCHYFALASRHWNGPQAGALRLRLRETAQSEPQPDRARAHAARRVFDIRAVKKTDSSLRNRALPSRFLPLCRAIVTPAVPGSALGVGRAFATWATGPQGPPLAGEELLRVI